jgi:hypothetical protein
VIPTVDTLTHLFGYFKVIRTCHGKLRYFDWDGQVHLAKGKTSGHQGDPLEMLIFNLTIHHLWGRVLPKFQEARAIEYVDDGYIKAKLFVVLQVLTELKTVFKEDAGLDLNVVKTVILPAEGVMQQAAFDVAHNIITASPALTHLQWKLLLTPFDLKVSLVSGTPRTITCGVEITNSPITLANLSFINLVSIFRCSSSPCHPVYVRRVDPSVLPYSLSSHRHSHISLLFIFRFID